MSPSLSPILADNEVNGVPTCLSPLMKAAREAWNFTGYVTSDSDSIADAWASATNFIVFGAMLGECDFRPPHLMGRGRVLAERSPSKY